jgi:esterase
MILRCVRMGEGPAVVLLHGLFGSASNWGRIQRRLAETRTVLAMDLRNHGSSPHDPAMTYPDMAEDVAETMAEHGVGAAGVLGHSMGGKVAMQLALARPALVARLLVADVAPVRYEPHFRVIAAAMRAMPLTPGLGRAEASTALEASTPDPAVRGFLLQNLRFGAPPAWRIGLDEIAAALPEIEGWPGQGRYDGPTLVLRGERSDYVLPEHRPLFRALFPAARFVTLRDAGHWLHADAPEPFLATVSSFFPAG